MPSAGIFLALSDYLAQVRRLLRDPSPGALYTDPDLTEYINRAMQQRDLDLGIVRVKMSLALTIGVSQYSFATIAAGTLLAGPSTANLQDLISVIVMPLGGTNSAIRYPMGRIPYSELSFLLTTAYQSYPVLYSIYGPSTVFLGPPPAAAYTTEFDFVGYGAALVNSSDTDQQPYPYTDPVPFMACALAKAGAQHFDEADAFEGAYMNRLNRVRSRAKPMAVRNPWNSRLLRGR